MLEHRFWSRNCPYDLRTTSIPPRSVDECGILHQTMEEKTEACAIIRAMSVLSINDDDDNEGGGVNDE
ncbi:uncharacterized protein LOC143261242 isoform X2 [Megalopta genalis]|uniref:uncharacterized protein LOC143261242 isoform X2 n=1 Tax=Megalopta genalis TaxID=115081 RepID=UPI003FCFE69B